MLLKDDYCLEYCCNSIFNEPELRESIWRYLEVIGPKLRSLRAIEAYLKGEHALDDASLFHAARTLTMWEVGPNTSRHRALRDLGKVLGSDQFIQRSAFFFIAALWVLGKYGHRKDIAELIFRASWLRQTSEFLARQVASLLPKLRGAPDAKKIRGMIASHKHGVATSVLLSLNRIACPPMEKSLRRSDCTC
jgi:hypothetical protein